MARIKTQADYELRKKLNERDSKRFRQMVKSGKVAKAQPLLKEINKEYAYIRRWEKDNGIYRYPSFKVGNVTYQVL